MFKTSLYLNLNSEATKQSILQLLGSQEPEKKIQGMKDLIAQMSQGKSYGDITHTVIKDVLSVQQNNELRRLFYYFLEMSSISTNELLLLSNQIRKDLEHPNEFMRGVALRYVSKLTTIEILLNFHKPILENFTHKIAYVRRHAYYSLGRVSKRLGIFEDTADHLVQALQRDTDPACLCQAFVSLYELDKEKSMQVVPTDPDLALTMMEKIQDNKFLIPFLENEDSKVRIEACLHLLQSSTDIEVLEKATKILLNEVVCEEYKEYLPQAFSKISSTISTEQSQAILGFLDNSNHDFSKAILDFVLSHSPTQDLITILNILLKSSEFNSLLISRLTEVVSRFSVYTPEMVDLCLKTAFSKNPSQSYECLKLIRSLLPILNEEEKERVVDFLIKNISQIKFGKIFRTVLNILVEEGRKFEDILKIFQSGLKNKNGEALIWLERDSAFLIPFIAISLTEMFYKNNSENNKVALLSLLLSFFKLVKDKSSIVSCIRRLQSPITTGIPRNPESSIKINTGTSVGDPFEIFKSYSQESSEAAVRKFLEARDHSETSLYQLTGLSDPIYVEASVFYSRFEIVLDLLMINQTDSYLQNMLFDFGSSPNLKPVYFSSPGNMKARSVDSHKLVFRILDSANGFVNGSVSFKYPSESGEYQNYTLNFSEIKTFVSLEPNPISPDSFRDLWKKMEWENVYSVKLLSSKSPNELFNIFKKKLKGTVVEIQKDSSDDFFVGNISSSTKQNNMIFFNICMTRESSYINLECRVRSSKEEIVKSMNDILNEVVKMNKSL
ncbi:Coatomer subunit beta [Nosema granulosis]|uniref:Coatomer subunit beta n=1 Tax=Nosema granulosis TaxID=83296 RepID=A0A9P6GZ01_9MICR|nr:Coatomer subunit beta [Nosema granulosis]